MIQRRKTRQVRVGNVLIGGDAPVSVRISHGRGHGQQALFLADEHAHVLHRRHSKAAHLLEWIYNSMLARAGFIVVTACYLYVLSTTIGLAENSRYRFVIEPLMVVLAATALTTLIRSLRQRQRNVTPSLRLRE